MRIVALVLTLYYLAGCATVEYFKPVPGEDAVVERNSYRGPSEIVVIKPSEKLTFKLLIFPDPSYRMIRAYFKLPKGETLRFTDGVFTITEASGAVRVEKIPLIEGNHIVDGVGQIVEYAATDILPGETYRYKKTFGGYGEGARYYQIDVPLKNPLPDNFSLYFPEFKLNGVTYKYQPISYVRKTGSFYQASPW